MIDLSADETARAFGFDGGRVGCLLLHGFTGTPAEMRPLGERLAAEGYSVRAPLLPGHSARVEDLALTRWQDWFETALEAWDDLGRTAPIRVAAGLSMGALLTLHLAQVRPTEMRAAALLAPAFRLANARSASLSLWLRRLPRLARRFEIVRKKSAGHAGAIGRITPAYDEIPLRALASMIELQRVVGAELPAITVPALILEGGLDTTVAPASARAIEAALGSSVKRRMVFPKSGHILTEDQEAAAVIDAVVSFFAEQVR